MTQTVPAADVVGFDAYVFEVDGVLTDGGPVRDEGTVRVVEHLRARGVAVAAVSSSRNVHEVLEHAAVVSLFDAVVTGVEADELSLAGRPAPDLLLEAARRLSVPPARAAVIAAGAAGVEAGRRGGFGAVIGVDRHGTGELADRGAHVVVGDLAELVPALAARLPAIGDLPPADDLLQRLQPDQLAVFLDYDGTLTPIVDDPAAATLPPQTRQVIARLADLIPVAVVSGRDLEDVRSFVDLDGIAYAGSHGFDILRADGSRQRLAEGHLADLDAAEAMLRERLTGIDGAGIERKRFAIAVHDRQVTDPDALDRIDRIVREVASQQPRLRMTGGKAIHELRPDLGWDKGRAIVALLGAMGLRDRCPLYIGDDETDEDGFRSVKARSGYALVVRGENDDRPTLADAALSSPDQVRGFLAALAALTTLGLASAAGLRRRPRGRARGR